MTGIVSLLRRQVFPECGFYVPGLQLSELRLIAEVALGRESGLFLDDAVKGRLRLLGAALPASAGFQRRRARLGLGLGGDAVLTQILRHLALARLQGGDHAFQFSGFVLCISDGVFQQRDLRLDVDLPATAASARSSRSSFSASSIFSARSSCLRFSSMSRSLARCLRAATVPSSARTSSTRHRSRAGLARARFPEPHSRSPRRSCALRR